MVSIKTIAFERKWRVSPFPRVLKNIDSFFSIPAIYLYFQVVGGGIGEETTSRQRKSASRNWWLCAYLIEALEAEIRVVEEELRWEFRGDISGET